MTMQSGVGAGRPEHVPPKRFIDKALHDIALEADDPFLAIARLYDGPDIVWMTNACRGHPGWVPTRYRLFQKILLDPKTFSSKDNVQAGVMMGVDWKMNPLEIDPPEHAAYRQLLQRWFEPNAVAQMAPLIQQVCDELIDDFANATNCDFIADFAMYFPSHVFLAIMNLPRDELPQFLVWEKKFTRSSDPAIRAEGIRAILAYLEQVVAERRCNPGNDLISFIANAELDGRKLDHGEVMGMCTVLYVGGLDTVFNSLGWHMRAIATDTALQDRLRQNPDDIPLAVNELLRAFGITTTKRTVTRDIEFEGVAMKAGDYVALPTCLPGRDPLKWPEPDRIDIDRSGKNLTLAAGVHNCLGAHLARAEIGIVLRTFLSRFDNIHVPPNASVEWHAVGNFGVDKLPIAWAVRA